MNSRTISHTKSTSGRTRQIIMNCSCAHNTDGTTTTIMCSIHADTDPCLTMANVTGKRRKGTIRRGVCTSCGHRS